MDLIPLLAASFLRWNFESLARLTRGGNHMSLFKDLFKRADSGSKISPALPALLSTPEAFVLAVPGEKSEKSEKQVHPRLKALRQQACLDQAEGLEASSTVFSRSKFVARDISPVSIEKFLAEVSVDESRLKTRPAGTSLLFRTAPDRSLFQSPGLVGPAH